MLTDVVALWDNAIRCTEFANVYITCHESNRWELRFEVKEASVLGRALTMVVNWAKQEERDNPHATFDILTPIPAGEGAVPVIVLQAQVV